MKKRLSIKWRVTLWFTALMILLSVLVLSFLYLAGQHTVQSSSQERLTGIVTSCLNEIEYDDGTVEPDDDLDFFVSGVYLSIYDANGRLLYGRLPSGYNGVLAFSDDTTQQFDDADGSWYIYDVQYEVPSYGTVWVRGILSSDTANTAFSTLFQLALLALPLLVLLAALGGYLLIDRAFLPVRVIAQSADQISSGSDLSRRIALGESRDEIYLLAATFDRMFDRLEESFAREKQFTSDASHELRTPIAVILSQCDYSLSQPMTAAEGEQALRTVQQQAQKMSSLVAQLLALARAEQQQSTLHTEQVPLTELTELTALQLEEAAAEKKIRIHTDLQPAVLFRGDETMLLRLLLNLMENGIKYGRDGGNLWISLAEQEHTITLTVRDDGCGISAEDLPRIWDRFYQSDPSRSVSGGIGLGLTMVRYIAQVHGGTVSADSVRGSGSVFTVTFPLQN